MKSMERMLALYQATKKTFSKLEKDFRNTPTKEGALQVTKLSGVLLGLSEAMRIVDEDSQTKLVMPGDAEFKAPGAM